jgi:hypothetical protein
VVTAVVPEVAAVMVVPAVGTPAVAEKAVEEAAAEDREVARPKHVCIVKRIHRAHFDWPHG